MASVQNRLLQARCDGIEEQKEELESPTSAEEAARMQLPPEPKTPDKVGDEHGFRAQVESFAKALFGGCGTAIEAALNFWPSGGDGAGGGAARMHPHHHSAGVGGVGYHHPYGNHPNNAYPAYPAGYYAPHPHIVHNQEPPPLSIAEELRLLAAKDPVAYQQQQMAFFQGRTSDIPKFLGEDAVYSFEDDNISAISAHTLEEMARKNSRHHKGSPSVSKRKKSKQHPQHHSQHHGQQTQLQPSIQEHHSETLQPRESHESSEDEEQQRRQSRASSASSLLLQQQQSAFLSSTVPMTTINDTGEHPTASGSCFETGTNPPSPARTNSHSSSSKDVILATGEEEARGDI